MGTMTNETRKVAREARVSVSIEAGDYAELKRTATDRRVATARVVLDAVIKFLDGPTPLFARTVRGEEP